MLPTLVLTFCALLALLLLRGSLADTDAPALEELVERAHGGEEPEVPEVPEVPEGAAGEVAGLPDSVEPEGPDTAGGALPRDPERE